MCFGGERVERAEPVFIDDDHVSGADGDVRVRPASPPRLDGHRVGGCVLEPVRSERCLAVRLEWEDVEPFRGVAECCFL